MGFEIFQSRVGLDAPFKLYQNHPPVPVFLNKTRKLTVHLCGFSPVCRRMCTTSMYWALKGFSALEHPSHRHTKDFLFAWMWSLFMCLTSSSWVVNSVPQSFQWQFVSMKSPGSSLKSPCSPLPSDGWLFNPSFFTRPLFFRLSTSICGLFSSEFRLSLKLWKKNHFPLQLLMPEKRKLTSVLGRAAQCWGWGKCCDPCSPKVGVCAWGCNSGGAPGPRNNKAGCRAGLMAPVEKKLAEKRTI